MIAELFQAMVIADLSNAIPIAHAIEAIPIAGCRDSHREAIAIADMLQAIPIADLFKAIPIAHGIEASLRPSLRPIPRDSCPYPVAILDRVFASSLVAPGQRVVQLSSLVHRCKPARNAAIVDHVYVHHEW